MFISTWTEIILMMFSRKKKSQEAYKINTTYPLLVIVRLL